MFTFLNTYAKQMDEFHASIKNGEYTETRCHTNIYTESEFAFSVGMVVGGLASAVAVLGVYYVVH